MEAIVTVLDKLAIIFLLLIIGYVCKKKNIVNDGYIEGMSGFLTKIVIPCFVISSLQIEYTAALFQSAVIVFIACILMHFWGLIVGIVSVKLLKVPGNAKGIWIFGCMFANIGFMGVPVISLIFGGDSVFYCAFASFAFNIVAYTLGVFVLARCSQNQERKKMNIKELLKLPVNISMAVGLILFLLNIKLPSFIGNTVSMVGGMLSPLAMIFIGCILGKFDFKEMILEKWAYGISFLRLIFVPLTAYLILKNFIQDQLILGVIIVGLSTPIGALCAIIAAEFGEDEALASKYIFVTTLLCIFTMPAFFLLFV